MWDADGELNVPHRQWLVDFNTVMNEVRSSHPDDFVGARVILEYHFSSPMTNVSAVSAGDLYHDTIRVCGGTRVVSRRLYAAQARVS